MDSRPNDPAIARIRPTAAKIVRGREFTSADRDGAPRVAIVSDAVAAATWPGETPIGKRLKFGSTDSRNEWLTVVGVAGTTRYRELVTPRPTLYVPAEQFMISGGRLAIRTAAAPALVAAVVGDAVRATDPTVRVTRVAPYAEYLRLPLAWPRFNALLLAIFAVAALLLSAIGLYGVMAASVRQRQSDVSFGTAALVLVGASIVATWFPARRATRVDPIDVLRSQ